MMDKIVAGQTAFVNEEFIAENVRLMIVYGIKLPYYTKDYSTYYCFTSAKKYIKVMSTDRNPTIEIYDQPGTDVDGFMLKLVMDSGSYKECPEEEFWRNYHKAFMNLERQCHQHWEYAVENKTQPEKDDLPF